MQHTSTWGPPNLKIAYNCAICSRDIIIGTGKSFHCLVYKPIRSPNILMKQALLMLGLRIPDKIQGYAVARESMSWYKTFNWQYFYNLHVYVNELGELTNDVPSSLRCAIYSCLLNQYNRISFIWVHTT